MDLQAFARSPVGRLERTSFFDPRKQEQVNYWAFVPDPLPDTVQLSPAAHLAANRASTALGRLDGAGGRLPNPKLLVRPTIRKEAVSTSALEGTITELTDILESEALEAPASPDVLEVRNYVRAAEQGLLTLQERPIGLRLIGELHEILMKGTRGDSWESGRVRSQQNWIGPPDSGMQESFFVPPPPGEYLDAGLREWEKWIHREDIPIVVRVALGHYQFETLHPFKDGNGRMGRLLCILQLIEEGTPSHHLVAISSALEAIKPQYTSLLREASMTGNFDAWIIFFLEVLTAEANSALNRVNQLTGFREQAVAKLRGARVRGVAIEMAEDLIGFPVLSPSRAAEKYGITYQAANSAVLRLVEAGLLEEMTGRKYGRLFVCGQVIDIL